MSRWRMFQCEIRPKSFLISNIHHVQNVICYLPGNSPLPDTSPMEQIECSETLAYKIQTKGNYPEESIQYLQGVPLATELGISLIILTPMKILQRKLKRNGFVV